MLRPNINNLRKQAKTQGLTITKTTDATDAYILGGNRYVLHRPQEDWENMIDMSLVGIKNELNERTTEVCNE